MVGRSEGRLREEAAEGIGEDIRKLRLPCQDLAFAEEGAHQGVLQKVQQWANTPKAQKRRERKATRRA